MKVHYTLLLTIWLNTGALDIWAAGHDVCVKSAVNEKHKDMCIRKRTLLRPTGTAFAVQQQRTDQFCIRFGSHKDDRSPSFCSKYFVYE